MKRNKHILINLTDEQFNAIQFIAIKENRKISDIAYLLLINTINEKIINYVDIKNSGFKTLKYQSEE